MKHLICTDQLMDAGVDVLTLAYWSGCAPSEVMGRCYPEFAVKPLLDGLRYEGHKR